MLILAAVSAIAVLGAAGCGTSTTQGPGGSGTVTTASPVESPAVAAGDTGTAPTPGSTASGSTAPAATSPACDGSAGTGLGVGVLTATLAKEGDVGDITDAAAASFISAQVGWVTGTDMTYKSPDTFRSQQRIVVTTDGGRSWHLQYAGPWTTGS